MSEIKFRPVRGKEETVKGLDYQDGYIYFTTDTGKIYLDANDKRVTMGGNSGIFYGSMTIPEGTDTDQKDFTFTVDEIDGDQIPNEDDLILNIPDGCFYRVENVLEEEGIVETTKLTIAGSGGGAVGPGGAGSSIITIRDAEGSQTKYYTADAKGVKLYFNVDSNIKENNFITSMQVTFRGEKQEPDYEPKEFGDIVFDLEPYWDRMSKDVVNTFDIAIIDNYGTQKTINYRINVIELTLTSSITDEILYTSSKKYDYFSTPIGGTSLKNRRIVYNIYDEGGIEQEAVKPTDSLISSADEIKKTLLFDQLAHGIYVVTMQYMGETATGLTIKSNILSYKIINYCGDSSLLAVIQPPATIEQYSVLEIKYMIGGDPSSATGTSNIEVSIKGSKDMEANTSLLEDVKNNTIQTWRLYFDTIDTYDLTIDGVLLNQITVIPYEGVMPTIDENDESLMLLLKTTNRSNNDSNKNIWEYKNAVAELKDFYWGDINGWLVDKEGESMLHMTAGANLQIDNLYPFAQDAKQTGLTIEMDFKVSGVLDFNQPLIKCLSHDADETVEDRKIIAGFQITGQESTMNSANYQVTGSIIKESGAAEDQAYNTAIQGLTTKFTEDERIHLTWVIERYNSQSKTPPLVRTYLNGIMSGLTEYTGSGGNADQFKENPIDRALISIDSTYADIDIYNIRIYSKGLSPNAVLNNYIATSGKVDDRVLKALDNEITYEDGKINPEKVFHNEYELSVPYVKLIGGIKNNKDDKWFVQSTEERRLPYAKKDYRLMSFEFIDPSGKMPHVKENIKLENPATGSTVNSLDEAEVGFKTKEGCLVYGQGTSSMEYPVKNLRVKFKKNKFQVYEDAYPVDLLCFKADYMESSSSHNTGTGNLVYNLYRALGDNYKTPAQKFYNASNWGYDIVTAIKGFPVVIFYSPDGEKFEYIGKYNLNLDKATHEPFGFVSYDDGTTSFGIATDENGKPIYEEITYADEEEFDDSILPPYILKDGKYEEAEDFDANQTYYNRKETIHCFEFLNNASKLDNFLKEENDKTFRDSFYKLVSSEGKMVPNWTTCFESRFPEDATDEKYVESWFRMCNWVASFGPEVDEEKLPQFKAEFTNYFNLDFTLFYYVITHFLLMIDSRAKNMMMATWDDIHWYPIFYDMDTMLGLNNYGYNKFNYTAIDTEKNLYNAENSVLWKYFRVAFKEKIADTYNDLREAGLEYSKVVDNYNNNQADAWNEALYNADITYKYIRPFTEGYYTGDPDPKDPEKNYVAAGKRNYLYAAQGPRSMHRQWWLKNRFNFFDGMYLSDAYKEDYFEMRLYTPSSENGFVVDTSVNAENYEPGIHYIYNTETEAYEISNDPFDSETTYYKIDTGIAGSALVVPPCNDFTLTPLYDQYLSVGYGKGSNGQTVGPVFAKANTSQTLKASQASFIDTETYVYGGSFLKDLGDLSPQYMGKFNFPTSGQTKLEKLIIGNPHNEYYNPNFSSLDVGSSAPYLQELNIMNCRGLSNRTIDISQCGRIRKVLATGSGITGLAVPEFGILEELRLPSTIGTLSLINHSQLTDEGFTIGTCDYNSTTKVYNYENDFKGIRYLQVENTPINTYKIVMDSERLITVSLKGFEWTVTENTLNNGVLEQVDVLEKLKTKSSFDGISTLAASVSGNIHFAISGAKVNAIDIYNKYWELFPNVTFTYDDTVMDVVEALNITFLDGSKKPYWTKKIAEGLFVDNEFLASGPNGPFEEPTKASTASHYYSFTGVWLDQDNIEWTTEEIRGLPEVEKTLGAITKDWTFTPIFIEHIKQFELNYQWPGIDDYNNSTEYTRNDWVNYGNAIGSFPAELPYLLDNNLQLDEVWAFKGWTTNFKNNEGYTIVENMEEANAIRLSENTIITRNLQLRPIFMRDNVKNNVVDSRHLRTILDNVYGGVRIEIQSADGSLQGKICLPASIDGIPVVGVATKGFSDNGGIKTNAAKRITHIFWEEDAKVRIIGDNAFFNLPLLEYFEITSSLEEVDDFAFYLDRKLYPNEVSGNNLQKIGNSAYNSITVSYEQPSKKILKIGGTINKIGSRSFASNEFGYNKIQIGGPGEPSQLTEIADDAFLLSAWSTGLYESITIYTDDPTKEIWNSPAFAVATTVNKNPA